MYNIEEGFSIKDGILYLASSTSIGTNDAIENVIFCFYINDEDYIPGFYQGFVNDQLDDFRILKNDTLLEVPPIPNMYYPDPVYQSRAIQWNQFLMDALQKFLFENDYQRDLFNKIIGYGRLD